MAVSTQQRDQLLFDELSNFGFIMVEFPRILSDATQDWDGNIILSDYRFSEETKSMYLTLLGGYILISESKPESEDGVEIISHLVPVERDKIFVSECAIFRGLASTLFFGEIGGSLALMPESEGGSLFAGHL